MYLLSNSVYIGWCSTYYNRTVHMYMLLVKMYRNNARNGRDVVSAHRLISKRVTKR